MDRPTSRRGLVIFWALILTFLLTPVLVFFPPAVSDQAKVDVLIGERRLLARRTKHVAYPPGVYIRTPGPDWYVLAFTFEKLEFYIAFWNTKLHPAIVDAD
jgi:hypothetical protein